MRVSLLPLVATAMFVSQAQAELRACNETNELVSVAHAFINPENDTPFSKGWTNIAPNECQTLMQTDTPKGDTLYWRAVVLGRAIPDTGTEFCTSSFGFMAPTAICDTDGWSLKPYARTANKSPDITTLTFRSEDADFAIPGGSDELSRIDDLMQGRWVDQQNRPYVFDHDGEGLFAGTDPMFSGRVAKRCLSMPKSVKGTVIGYESSAQKGGKRFQCLLIDQISENELTLTTPLNGQQISLTRVQ